MYYNIQATKTNGAIAPAIYAFDAIKAARANHYYFLSSCYGNENLDYFLAEILDEQGNCVAREVYYKPLPQPETEDNGEEK